MTQKHFKKIPNTEWACFTPTEGGSEIPVDTSQSMLSFSGYATFNVQYIQLHQGGKVKVWLWQIAFFAEAAEEVSASSCSSSSSARGYKPCNSSSKSEQVPAPGTAAAGLPFLARII